MFFSERVKQLNEEKKERKAPVILEFKYSDTLQPDITYTKNYGYSVLSSIYHELSIDKFLINRQRHSKEEFDANTIMKMLVFSRLLYTASKKKSYDERSRFFERDDYSLDDVYRCLSLLCNHKDNLQIWINDRIKESYGRYSSLVYYDVTNYYLFNYYDEILLELGETFNINFTRRIRSLGEIKKNLSQTKK